MNKMERKSVLATLVDKQQLSYHPIPGKVPAPTEFYELEFQVEEQVLIFEVSVFEYTVMELGDTGALIYAGNRLISFADKIKEV